MSDPHAERRPLWRQLLRSLPVLAGVSLLMLTLHDSVLLWPVRNATLDAFLVLRQPRPASAVLLVDITDEDYETIFHGRSPLAVEALEKLIAATARGRPRLIVVDIDTSAPDFAGLDLPPGGPPVVWAREARPPEKKGGRFEPLPVLGGRTPAPSSGIAMLPLDSDGVIRRYQRWFETADGPLPSLPWKAVQVLQETGRGLQTVDEEHGRLVLNFLGDRSTIPRVPARDVLELAQGEGWPTGPLQGRVVVVGGTYRAGRDERVTPRGPMAGLELMAMALESELRDDFIRPANHVLMTLIEVLAGVLLVVIYHYLPLGRALALSLFAVPGLSLLASFLAFSTLAYWADAVPVFAAAMIHQLYDHAAHYRALYRRLLVEDRALSTSAVPAERAPAPQSAGRKVGKGRASRKRRRK